jgi:hypothetical protein
VIEHIDTIFFGQRIFKFKLPTKLIQDINNKMDEEIKNKTYTDAVKYLSAKIKNEYKINKWIGEIDKNKEIGNIINYVINEISWIDSGFNFQKVICDNAWINDQKEGEYQVVHKHSGSIDTGLSTIIFLNVPDFGEEYTNTSEPHNGRTTLISNGGGLFSLSAYLINPVVGDMYVFPYDIQHVVYPFQGKGIRRSLSMNFDIFKTKKTE